MNNEQPEAIICPVSFSRGVNFSGWFESSSAEGIPFIRYAERDFADVKSMGADVIRLPVNMHAMTLGAPNYNLDPLLVKFLDIAIGWAEKRQLFIIIDNHSFDPREPTDQNIEKILLKVWAQVAERYKNHGDYVIYEVLNEPHGISDNRWGEIQGMAIETIRKIDKKHTIIVGGTEYNSINKLASIPKYTDNNLIYTFHFYDPHIFTHQGANWETPSLASLAGLPFPADSKRMPKVPNDLKNSWVAEALSNYAHDAALTTLAASLDKAVAFSRERNVPVFCGEFGVYLIQSPPADRVNWYQIVTGMIESRNISRASWDYFGGFGIFKTKDGGDFNADLNVDVVRAMGFTFPPQRTQPLGPLTSGFVIYDDYPNREHLSGYLGKDVEFSLYDVSAAEGEFAIRWGNAEQYNVFWFGLERNGDFSKLVKTGHSLQFMARTEKPVQFDVRFKNPESAVSIPWRIRHSINETQLPPDGKWHTIRIPLKDMQEHGAWVEVKQEWLNPQGKFSWKQVNQLEFVAEDKDLKGCRIWFDSIKIIGP
jgi:endoglucanase